MARKLFPLGGPVPPEDVVDREDFLASLEVRLAEGQHLTLAGPRRIGKTSLTLEVLRRLRSRGFYTAFVDLFYLTGKRDLALAIIDSCLENRTGIRKTVAALAEGLKAAAGSAKLILKAADLELDFRLLAREEDEEGLLDRALEMPETLARRDGKRMVVAFDEFQEAARLAGEHVYKRMRAHFQMHENVSYLFLGSRESLMRTIFAGSREAFYRFAVALPIPPVPEEAWAEYIVRKFESASVRADAGAAREIVRLTGGHPQDTMLVCSEIHHLLLEAGEKALSLEAVRAGYERALSALSALFDKMLEELGANPRALEVLKRIVQGKSIYPRGRHPNEISRALELLKAKAIIEKSGRGSYRFVEPMFREYVLRQLS